MITVQTVLDFLWELAPEAGKEPWDNVGHLVGRASAPVEKILVALDITPEVIDEAANGGASLIVSHHPVIWDTHKFVTDAVLQQEKVLRLIEHHLAAICMHTNLDEAEGGVDDTLVKALGLTAIDHLAEGKIGHVCELLQPMDLQSFLKKVKADLHAGGLRYCDSGRPVFRVATGCGACGAYLPQAAAAGCDTFLTGDVKYSGFLDAKGYGMNLIDAGHFCTENPIVPVLADKLQARFPTLAVCTTQVQTQPDLYVS